MKTEQEIFDKYLSEYNYRFPGIYLYDKKAIDIIKNTMHYKIFELNEAFIEFYNTLPNFLKLSIRGWRKFLNI